MTAPPTTSAYTASTKISSINQENTPPADDHFSFLSAKVSHIATEIEANNEQREIFLKQRLQEKQQQQKMQAERYIYNYVNHKPDEVALHSFILGIVLVLSVVAAARLVNDGSYYQLPGYVASLAAFHFLEYWITARYNATKVTIDCMCNFE
jgi:hypothetical protein